MVITGATVSAGAAVLGEPAGVVSLPLPQLTKLNISPTHISFIALDIK